MDSIIDNLGPEPDPASFLADFSGNYGCSKPCQTQNFVFDTPYEVKPDKQVSYGPYLENFLAGNGKASYVVFSPGSVYLNKSRIKAILGWAVNRCDKLIVVEGGYLNRWNLRALNGCSELRASKIAKEDANMNQLRLRSVVNAANAEEHVLVLNYRKTLSDPKFKDILYKIRNHLKTAHDFKDSVEREIDNFLSRRKGKPNALTTEHYQYLTSYVIEELSMFTYLHNLGYKTEIYTGPDLVSMMKLIADSSQIGIDLTNRTQIAISMDRKTKPAS